MRGPHRYGIANDAGKELLVLLSMCEATICSTQFKRQDIERRPGNIQSQNTGIILLCHHAPERMRWML